MADIGTLTPLSPLPLAGLSARSTDHAAQCHIIDEAAGVDVGYVTVPVKRRVFLWNGKTSIQSVQEVESSESAGITIDGVDAGTIIQGLSAVEVAFTISQYGPIEFTADYIFVASCTEHPPFSISGTRPLFSAEQPRPITLDMAIEEAYAQPSSGDTFYDTLEFTDSVSGQAVMIVHSDEDLNTPQGTYTACRFGCKHPETEGGIVGQMQITIDFLPMDVQKWLLNTCRTRANITVYWRQYLGPGMEPDAVYPVPLDVVGVEQTSLGATITASFPMLTAMKFPRRLMTTSIMPGGLT